MSKDKAFLAVVQAGLYDIGRHAYFASGRDVFDIVARATEIQDWHIPKDVAEAGRSYVRYAIGAADKPDWYIRWQEVCQVKGW